MQQQRPQVLPRNSLLKKQPQQSSNNDEDLPKSGIITKPALPAKPQIPSKPSNLVRQQNNDDGPTNKSSSSISNHVQTPSPPPGTSNHISNDVVDHNSTSEKKMELTQKSVITNQCLKMIKESPNRSNKKSLPKFRINNSELNRLRFRRDFFDDKQTDGKGNFLIYDVREDDEQIAKMNEIHELLVAGGYFRARIKGLHNFDKIIGGMCWAIQMCNIDLDVDVFYQENLSIGQKIALTEKIVCVLQQMKCPFKLEPHQIQGMDCIHIYPAIQWLVKKSLETRQQTADYIRSYSTWQFDRTFRESVTDSATNKSSVIFSDDALLDPIKANLQRRFFHPGRSKLKDEPIRVRTTLLEYGIVGTGQDQRVIMSTTDAGKQEKSEDVTEERNLLGSMTELDVAKVSTAVVGQIVSEQSEEIKRLAEDYERNRENIDSETKREETRLRTELAAKKKELNRLMQENREEKLNVINEKLKMIEEKSQELKESEQMNENDDQTVQAEKIRLTELLNVLRKQKIELKQHCREEKQRLEKQIESIEAEQVDSEQMNEKLKEIDRQLAVNEERCSAIKRQLADVNKRYAIIQRRFDDVPNRIELAQYQKRFLELYQQLADKHNETRKFYTLYNTLSDERMYLEKEFNLINSILENFQKASVSNAMVKDEFLVKFQQTVDSIVLNKNKVEQRLQNEKEKKDRLNGEYSQFIEEQRLYYIAVKAFKEECKINEQLIVQLDKNK